MSVICDVVGVWRFLRTAFVGGWGCLLIYIVQDPWYQVSKVFDPTKQTFVVAAAGDLCWVHGISLESFLPKTKEQMQAEIVAVPQTAHEWELVVGSVEKAQASDTQRQDFIRGSSSCGITVSMKAGYINAENFLKHFGMDIITAGFEQLDFPFLPRELRKGTILKRSTIPPGLVWEKVNVWATQDRSHEQLLLGPSGTFRKEQPKNRYDLAVSSMLHKRGASIRSLASGADAPTYQDVQKAVAEINRQRLLANEGQAAAGSVARGAVSVQTAGGLQSDSEGEGQNTAGTRRVLRGGQGRPAAAGAERSSAKASAASPSPPAAALPLGGQPAPRTPATPRKPWPKLAPRALPDTSSPSAVVPATPPGALLQVNLNDDEFDMAAIQLGAMPGRQLRKVD